MATRLRNASPSVVEYPALRGTFGRVSYFVTKASLRDVAENLMLAPQGELTFTERIQRVLNERRIANEILPYLQENELRFFNALVCVLLPDKDSGDWFWSFEEFADEEGHSLGGLGKLRVTKRVGRVVLDGQHRFEALRRFWALHKSTPDSDEARMEIALMFLVIDQMGEKGSRGSQLRTQTITSARNLFAVLNKTARSVDKTTLLLIDDSDISNVMTRAVLEEGTINEEWVKWTGGQNLQPTDPYFTGIHVIKDSVRHLLRDHSTVLAKDMGNENERKQALMEYFENTPDASISTREAIPVLFNKCEAVGAWLGFLKSLRIKLMRQPDDTPMSRDARRAVKERREGDLLFTIAGQKAFFRGVIDAFATSKTRNRSALLSAIEKGNRLYCAGEMRRTVDDNNPFLGLLFDRRGRMSWAESAVDCARRIIGITLGSKTNRETTLQDFETLTARSPDVVREFWARKRPARKKRRVAGRTKTTTKESKKREAKSKKTARKTKQAGRA